MRKFLDSILLIGRQPVIHRNGDGVIWCVSPSTIDYKIRKLNLDEEMEFYKLLISETGSPVMHNTWFSTLMANAMYARFAARGCSFCYLNSPGDSQWFVRARFRQASRVGPSVCIKFMWGPPTILSCGEIGNDLGAKISKMFGCDHVAGKNGRNEISIYLKPAMRHSSISTICDYVFSCLL